MTKVFTIPTAGQDPSEPAVRRDLQEKLNLHLARVYGDQAATVEEDSLHWLWPRYGDPTDTVRVVAARAGMQVIGLAPGTRPSAGAEVMAKIREAGLEPIAFHPYEGYALGDSGMDVRTKRLRIQLAESLKAADLWSLEVAAIWAEKDGVEYPVEVIIHRGPAIDSEKRRETWLGVIRDVAPPEPGMLWLFEQGHRPDAIRLSQVEDKLNQLLDYPWESVPTYKSIPFGMREDGHPLTLGLLEVNQLLGGSPGGGKSGGLTALMCGIGRLENVALIGLDPKMVEMSSWGPRFSGIATSEDDASNFLAAAVDEMERRYQDLMERGLKKLTPDLLTPEQPLLVIIIDELADLVSVGATKEDKAAEAMRSTYIRRLIAKGRAAGIVVIAATQKPQSDVIPTALRDMIQLRVAYACTTDAMTDTILGAGMSRSGGLAHTIPARQQGVCFVVSESSRTPVRARTYWVPDEEVADIAERLSPLRIDLPWLPELGMPVESE